MTSSHVAIKRLFTKAGELGVSVKVWRACPRQIRGKLAAYHHPKRMVIVLGPLRGRRLIFSLAHELGHAIDLGRSEKRTLNYYLGAIGLFNRTLNRGEVPPRRLKRTILGIERRANRLAKKLLGDLGISMPSGSVDRMIRNSMTSYERAFSKEGRT